MSVKITELPILDSLADNDIVAGVDVSGNVTSKIEMSTLKNYIDTNTQYTAGTNIDITNNVISAPDVYNKDEMDNQIEELQNEVDSLSTIFNAFPTESDEDESMTLDGTAEVKFKKFDLKGNTSQTGTPTPSSPIPVNVVSGDNEIVIRGKNLFDYNDFSTKITTATITGVANNFKIERISTNKTNYYLDLPSGVAYTFSGKWSTTYGNGALSIYYDDGTRAGFLVSNYSTSSTNGNISFTTEANKKISYLKIELYNNCNFTLEDFMLNNGTSASTYEPFNGNTYNMNLPVENLLPFQSQDFTINNVRYYCNNGNLYLNGTSTGETYQTNQAFKDNFSFYLEAGTYTFKQNILDSGSANYFGKSIVRYSNNSSIAYINNSNSQATFTLTERTQVYLGFYIYQKAFTNETFNLQLEKGSKTNTFTPYGTTPIELCKIGNYQDYFYKDSDKWYLHKEIGKELVNVSVASDWGFINNSFQSNSAVPSDIVDISSSISALSNNFKYEYHASGITGNLSNGAFGWNSSKKITFKIDGMTSKQNYIDWFTNNTTYVYFQLATPTNTEITYQPLIDQLNAIERAMSKDKQTNISQVNNDKPFIINAEAILSLKNVLDRVTLLES